MADEPISAWDEDALRAPVPPVLAGRREAEAEAAAAAKARGKGSDGYRQWLLDGYRLSA